MPCSARSAVLLLAEKHCRRTIRPRLGVGDHFSTGICRVQRTQPNQRSCGARLLELVSWLRADRRGRTARQKIWLFAHSVVSAPSQSTSAICGRANRIAGTEAADSEWPCLGVGNRALTTPRLEHWLNSAESKSRSQSLTSSR
jgi:hypothetical protein